MKQACILQIREKRGFYRSAAFGASGLILAQDRYQTSIVADIFACEAFSVMNRLCNSDDYASNRILCNNSYCIRSHMLRSLHTEHIVSKCTQIY